MTCSKCGGSVEWEEELYHLTQTKCQTCGGSVEWGGAKNNQVILDYEDYEDCGGTWDRVENSGEIEWEEKL